MPTLTWIGKHAVENHHLEIPYRLLEEDEKFSAGNSESGNLLVQGDNLHALKALLPYYAGKVKCVCIDPPYNTGNENWVYNDNTNSPEIKAWLNKVVGSEGEDLSRHDKWLCMMYPRLQLLKKFLRKDGVIFVHIDDNEVHHLRMLMNEIFGQNNFVGELIWRKKEGGGQTDDFFVREHEYILVFRRSDRFLWLNEKRIQDIHKFNKQDSNGKYYLLKLAKWGSGARRVDRPTMYFSLKSPDGTLVYPKAPDGSEGRWRVGKPRMNELEAKQLIEWEKKNGGWVLYEKIYFDENKEKVIKARSILYEIANTADATNVLTNIFGIKDFFDTPKPIELTKFLIERSTDSNSLVLDSFSGSGTTGHAVLQLNKEDGGERKFILVELEEKIAKEVTAERLKRVVNGYTITKQNGTTENVEGLGSGFRYCKLSEPLFDKFGNVKTNVRFKQLAYHVFFSETGIPLREKAKLTTPLLGIHNGVAYYLLFNGILGDKTVNGGNVLTSKILEKLPKHNGAKIIFGESNRIGSSRLKKEKIVFKQIPYEIKVS